MLISMPVPETFDEAAAIVAAVLADLARKSLPLPAQGENVTRPELEAHLQNVVGAAIEHELETDPAGRGYAGKTDAEAHALLTEGFTLPLAEPLVDPQPPRLGVVLAGIPFAPNAVTVDDVAAARG